MEINDNINIDTSCIEFLKVKISKKSYKIKNVTVLPDKLKILSKKECTYSLNFKKYLHHLKNNCTYELPSTVMNYNSNIELVKKKINKTNSTKEKFKLLPTAKSYNIKELIVESDESDIDYEDESLIEEDESDLSTLNVMIPFPVPITHLIETRITSALTPEQKKQFEEIDIKLKTGVFTKQEDSIIKQNWLEFCKMHDLSENPAPFLNFKKKNVREIKQEEKIKFVRFLGRNLPNRKLSSIYQRFQRLFLNQKKGKFTPKENRLILKFAEKQPNNMFSKLSKILKRNRIMIERHYKNLIRKLENTGAYEVKKNNVEYFHSVIAELLKVTKVNDVNELKYKKIQQETWIELSNKFFKSRKQIRDNWEFSIYPKLFSTSVERYNIITSKLLDKLEELNVDDWREVKWNVICKDFDGVTPRYIYKEFKRLVSRVPLDERHSLKKCVNFLKLHKPKYKKEFDFKYEDGTLFVEFT